MDGNFNDASGNGYDLVPLSTGQVFSVDEELKAGSNTCYGPVPPACTKPGAVLEAMPSSISNGLTICGFMAKPGGNDYGGVAFGFGSTEWMKSRLLISMPSGVVAGSVGLKGTQRYKRVHEGAWHHFALVVPPEGAHSDSYLLYVDGQQVLTGAVERLESYGPFQAGTFSGNQAEDVKLDEVKVFARVLSDEEIMGEAKQYGKKRPVARARPRFRGVDRREVPEELTAPHGDLKIHFLTRDWLCVIGNYNDFIRGRIVAECGDFLKRLDETKDQVPAWSYNFHYNFAAREVIGDYRPMIKTNFDDSSYFSIQSDGQPVAISESAYWLNAIGLMRVKTLLNSEVKEVNSAEVEHVAYLKLATPLTDGHTYTVSTRHGETVSFEYNEKDSISWGIKVNQVGYSPDAGRKYAYLGVWLADLGPLDLADFAGKPFYLCNAEDQTNVFEGTIAFRSKDVLRDGKTPVYGEDIYEMDFSSFCTPGEYFVYIPGVGRSWRFRVDSDAIGEAFYTHARGLFHQRSGMALEGKFTPWPMDADHVGSWVGGFAPNSGHYRKGDDPGYGFFDENGAQISMKPFTVVRETATDEFLPDVWGGWRDAADYDRRTHHFQVVRDLLSAYLMFPDKFLDGQLHIPESGNGIPDIVDEAVWGVDVWRRAQNESGGVGCWLEATSHPHNPDPALDDQRYYLALPTRESTMEYAAHAALMAVAYQTCGQQELSHRFGQSATEAFHYAMEPTNSVVHRWPHTVRGSGGAEETVEYTYREGTNVPGVRVFKAALNLYLLNGDEHYLNVMRQYEKDFYGSVRQMHWRESPFYFAELTTTDDPRLAAYRDAHRQRVIELADKRLTFQEGHAYRNLFWPVDHGYFTHMSWGNIHPLRQGRIFAAAHRYTRDPKYRDALLLLNDWQCGANPMGRTFTSGLGTVYPVRFLHLPSYSDGIDEFVPGITIYGLTYGIAYRARQLAHGLYLEDRADHGFKAQNICLLPKRLTDGVNLDFDKSTEALGRALPVYRRFCNIEGHAVAQNEFTVWETIGPCAAMTGCLMPDGWLPSETLKNRKPVSSIRDLEGYLPQP